MLKEFFAMGGYAFYVWWSYGLVAGVLLWNLWAARRQKQKVIQEIEQMREENDGDA